MPRVLAALASTVALAACGGLLNPDLATGTISGHLSNATASAYLYPLGRPDLVVSPAPDGSYTIEKVPVETTSLVVVDGPAGSWQASLVPVMVQSAGKTTVPDVDAAAMLPAGSVGAIARLGGGCDSTSTRFTVVGTNQIDVAPAVAGGAALLEPLPAGTFLLEARSPGFQTGSAAVTVFAGATVAYDVAEGVELDDTTPGCTAEGASCRTGLFCNGDDGVCYECLSSAECAGSTTGETECVNHACRAPAAAGETCDPCSAGTECASGVCAVDGGFCTRACAPVNGGGDCPAGFACVSDGTSGATVCKAPRGCDEAKETFGAECFYDTACAADLANCKCQGADPTLDPPVPGYCTGRCTTADDCTLVPGYTCDSASGVCVKP